MRCIIARTYLLNALNKVGNNPIITQALSAGLYENDSAASRAKKKFSSGA